MLDRYQTGTESVHKHSPAAPGMNYIVERNRTEQNIRWGVNISGISSVACWVCDCVCVGVLKVHNKTIS